MLSLPPLRPGNGVIEEMRPEFEVILRNGTMYIDSFGQFLFTKPRATLLSRRERGKMWLMPHTPYSSPGSFCPVQRAFFLARRCSFLADPAARRRRAALCGSPSAVRADYGYCAAHAGKLLAAWQDPGN